MAYVEGQPGKKEDEEDPSNQEIFTGRGSAAIEDAPVGASGASSPQQSNPQNNQKTFAGILDYVKANRSQTSGLANQLAKNVTGYGQTARSNLATTQNNFNKDVDKNTVGVDQDVFNKAQNDPTSLVGGVKDVSKIANEPQFTAPNTFTNNKVNVTGAPTLNNNFKVDPGPTSLNTNVVTSKFNAPANLTSNSVNATGTPTLNDSLKPDVGLSKQKGTLDNLGDLKTFLKMRDAEYKGPTSLQDTGSYKPTEDSFNKAETASADARTEQGNRNLLDDLQTKQLGYTNQGSLLLNQALLRGDLGARQTLQNAAASNDDLESLLSGAQGASTKRADTAAATTDATRKKIQDVIGGQQGNLENDLTRRSTEANKQAETQSQTIIDKLSNGIDPSPDELSLLGVTPEQWDKLVTSIGYVRKNGGSDFDVTNYIQNQLPEITPQNIASAQEYARYQALGKLMGNDGQFLSDPSLAGTANTDTVDFDIDQALADLAQLYPEEGTVTNTQTAPVRTGPPAGKFHRRGVAKPA